MTVRSLAAGRRCLSLALTCGLAVTIGCAKKKDPLAGTYLTAEQIYMHGLTELEHDDLRQALSILEQISYGPDDREEIEPLVRLAIADATFYQSYGVSLIDARALYLDFVALYGDHPRVGYAQFMAGVCSLGQVSHPSRDQSQTHQAIADLRVVIERWPASRFADAARAMIREAEQNLAEHEFMVGRFYLNRKAPAAAAERFTIILDRYPQYRDKEKLYYYLGQAQLLAGNDSEGRIYLDKLVKDFPEGEYTNRAIKDLAKAGESPQGFSMTPSRPPG